MYVCRRGCATVQHTHTHRGQRLAAYTKYSRLGSEVAGLASGEGRRERVRRRRSWNNRRERLEEEEEDDEKEM